MRLAEALVVRAADELRDRLRVAVGGVEVEPRIDRTCRTGSPARACTTSMRQPSGRKRNVLPEFIVDLVAVLALDLRVVREAVAGVDPAVGHQRERVDHAVRVADAEAGEEHFALVGLAVAVGVGELAGSRRRSRRCTTCSPAAAGRRWGCSGRRRRSATFFALPSRAEVGEDEELVGAFAVRRRRTDSGATS